MPLEIKVQFPEIPNLPNFPQLASSGEYVQVLIEGYAHTEDGATRIYGTRMHAIQMNRTLDRFDLRKSEEAAIEQSLVQDFLSRLRSATLTEQEAKELHDVIRARTRADKNNHAFSYFENWKRELGYFKLIFPTDREARIAFIHIRGEDGEDETFPLDLARDVHYQKSQVEAFLEIVRLKHG